MNQSLTVYITRYIQSQEQYLMFIECIECIINHIKDFDINIIVFADNENEITKEYDDIIINTFNIQIIKPEDNINPEWYAYMYHIKYHPTEYMTYIMDNTMITKDIYADKVINAINKYGQYALCYNECISKFFKLRYDLIKIFIPELIELGSYCDYIDNNITCKHVSAQGNQLFTSFTALRKMFNKFPNLVKYILTAKSYADEQSTKIDSSKVNQYKRDIRSLCDYVTSQCFFYTFQFPEELKQFDETEDCLYGFVITNWTRLKMYLGRFQDDPTSWCIQPKYWNKYIKVKQNTDISKYFVKFTTLRQK